MSQHFTQTTSLKCPQCGGMILETRTVREPNDPPTVKEGSELECSECRRAISRREQMHLRLKAWVPHGTEVAMPTHSPEWKTFLRWPMTFPGKSVARVSFRTVEVEQAQDRLWAVIRDKQLLTGKSGTFRVEVNGTITPDPPEWDGW